MGARRKRKHGDGYEYDYDDEPTSPLSAGRGSSSAATTSPRAAVSSGQPAPRIDTDALPLPTEADKLTRGLFGESYSHACAILDLHGKNAIFFVFADLSVKLEGLFRPRYRFFDLFSRLRGDEDVPILAECWGGVFAVYSTKEFPGLRASTKLTKHLNRWGIRVNIRETERKRRANNTGGAKGKGGKRGGGAGGGNGGGGASGDNDEDEDEDEDEDGTNAMRMAAQAAAGSSAGVVDAPKRFLEGTHAARGRASKRGRGGASGSGWRRGKGSGTG